MEVLHPLRPGNQVSNAFILPMVGPCWIGSRPVSLMHFASCRTVGSRKFKIKTNSSGNINKHLKEKHPDAVAICTGAAAVGASDEITGSTTGSQANTSQRLSDMWARKAVTKGSKIVIDLAYTIQAIDTNTPFQQTTNAFARHCFYRTMTTLRAQFTAELPSIDTQKSMVRMIHEFFLLTHKENLRLAQEDVGNPFVSLQFDFWTDPAGRSFGALNFSILDSQFNIQRGCLGCGEMGKRHTAEQIAHWVQAQLGACRPCMYCAPLCWCYCCSRPSRSLCSGAQLEWVLTRTSSTSGPLTALQMAWQLSSNLPLQQTTQTVS